LTCLLAVAIGSALWLQSASWSQDASGEFSGDTFKSEQIIVTPFGTGLINKAKMRDIYTHTRTVPLPPIKVPQYKKVPSDYTFLPHQVRPVAKGHWQPGEWVSDGTQWIASPTVGVGGSSSSHRSHRRHRRHRSK